MKRQILNSLIIGFGLFTAMGPSAGFAENIDALFTQEELAGWKSEVFNNSDAISGISFEQMPRYKLKLKINQDLSSYEVQQELFFKGLSSFKNDELILNMPANASVYNENQPKAVNIIAAVVNGESVESNLKGDILTLKLNPNFSSKDGVLVKLSFKAKVPKLPVPPSMVQEGLQQAIQMFGGGHNHSKNYGVYGLSDEILSLSHWHAILPHEDEGSVNDMELSGIGDADDFDASNYRVSIAYPVGLKVVTSGIDSETERTSEGEVVQSLAMGVREFTVSASRSFSKETVTVDDTSINCYFKPKNQPRCSEVLEYAGDSLKQFNELFGKYPYKELDIVEAPLRGGAGGMEYSGLITVSSGSLAPFDLGNVKLFKKLAETTQHSPVLDMTKDILEFTVVHEVAHQWWHGLVGSSAKSSPFIDEALTNYSTILYYEKQHGRAAAEKQTYMQLKLPYQLYRFSNNSDIPIRMPASSFSDSIQYGAIVYGKGALFYSALRNELGDSAFFEVLKNYFFKNRFGFVNESKLKSELTAIAENRGRDSGRIAALVDRWVNGTSGDNDIGILELDRVAETFLGPDIFKGKDGMKARLLLRLMGPLKLAFDK